MNLLAKAAGYLQSRMIESASEPMRYIRAGVVYDMRAVVGQLVTDQTDVNGFVLRTVTRDFTISQSAFTWSDDNKPKGSTYRQNKISTSRRLLARLHCQR